MCRAIFSRSMAGGWRDKFVDMTITCFGELLLRLTAQDSYPLTQAEMLRVHAGGAEANVAVALASLGHDVRFAGVVTGNPLGKQAVRALSGAGVDVRFLTRSDGRMGLYFLEEGSGARNSSIIYDRKGSAFAEAVPEQIDFAGALDGASLLHTGGITPALGPNGVELALAANAAADAAGVPICFDGNYRAQLWQAWESDPRAILTQLVQSATILIGNHRDISLLLDQNFSGEGADARRAASEAAFAAFPRLQLIASTSRQILDSSHHRLAGRVDTRVTWHQTERFDVTGIVDRIGTGDAFAAGVIHRWLLGDDERAMAENGLALAALKHSLPGDMCLLDRDALAAFSAAGGDVRR